MAKNTKLAEAPTPYEPPTSIRTTKAQAAGVEFDEKVTITVEGTVSKIGTSGYPEGSDMVEIELKPAKVVSISGNAADRELKKMKG